MSTLSCSMVSTIPVNTFLGGWLALLPSLLVCQAALGVVCFQALNFIYILSMNGTWLKFPCLEPLVFDRLMLRWASPASQQFTSELCPLGFPAFWYHEKLWMGPVSNHTGPHVQNWFHIWKLKSIFKYEINFGAWYSFLTYEVHPVPCKCKFIETKRNLCFEYWA